MLLRAGRRTILTWRRHAPPLEARRSHAANPLVETARAGHEDVRHVRVNGRPVSPDSRILTLDAAALLAKAAAYRAKISASLK